MFPCASNAVNVRTLAVPAVWVAEPVTANWAAAPATMSKAVLVAPVNPELATVSV